MKSHAILVVEDSLEDFETISEAAMKASPEAEVVHALDANEASELLADFWARNGRGFSMMLLDYNLPGKNGRDFLQEFSKSASNHLTPVVVFTTSSSPKDCQECYEAGANAYHTKSVKYEECQKTLGGIFDYWLNRTMLPAFC